MITRGQPIQKSQLDELAVLANAKLPLKLKRFDGTQAQEDFEFLDTGWKTELERIRKNLQQYLDYSTVYAPGYRPGPETMLSGFWTMTTLVQAARGINVKTVVKQHNSVCWVTENPSVVMYLKTYNSYPTRPDVVIPHVRTVCQNVIATGTVYRYDVTVPNTEDNYNDIYPSYSDGVWYVKTRMHSPNMNPKSSEAPWVNYDERISRFAPLVHRCLNPYAELPTPYPPAEINYEQQGDLSGQTIPASYTQFYDGLAEYFYGLAPDIRGPKSPSASSYYRIPTYPIRKRADGEYQPFRNEAIASIKDFYTIVRLGMVDSVTVSRTTSTAEETVKIGNFIGGAWRELHSETLSIGERSKTFYPNLIVFADAPLYYDAPETFNVMPTFVGKEPYGSNPVVGWPIHSCYYNDTEALLNALP